MNLLTISMNYRIFLVYMDEKFFSIYLYSKLILQQILETMVYFYKVISLLFSQLKWSDDDNDGGGG